MKLIFNLYEKISWIVQSLCLAQSAPAKSATPLWYQDWAETPKVSILIEQSNYFLNLFKYSGKSTCSMSAWPSVFLTHWSKTVGRGEDSLAAILILLSLASNSALSIDSPWITKPCCSSTAFLISSGVGSNTNFSSDSSSDHWFCYAADCWVAIKKASGARRPPNRMPLLP